MRLFLVRHAQTPSNVVGALDTAAPGAGLTELGRRQAAAAGAVLSERGVQHVHASPLVRTQQTAEPLATTLGRPSAVHDGLAEIGAGDLEMRTDPEALQAYATAVLGWLAGDLDVRVGGGGNGHEFLERYDAAVLAIAEAAAGSTAAAFSHGAAIRTWVALRVVNPEDLLRLAGGAGPGAGLRNTGCIVLDGDPERGWRAVAWENVPLGGAELDTPDPFDTAAAPA